MMSDIKIILGRSYPPGNPAIPWEDHLLVAIWKGFLWIMTVFYCVGIHNYSDIKKLSPSSVIYEKKRTEPVHLGLNELMK